jgi:hypothetical protein
MYLRMEMFADREGSGVMALVVVVVVGAEDDMLVIEEGV